MNKVILSGFMKTLGNYREVGGETEVIRRPGEHVGWRVHLRCHVLGIEGHSWVACNQ